MSKARDIWYVRFPDGQIVRAKSTASVRRHLEKGRIPLDCRVRRSGQYEWTTLEWAPEFADLLSRSTKPDKTEPKPGPRVTVPEPESPDDFELRTVGTPGVFAELLAAIDSSFHYLKLNFAAASALFVALMLIVGRRLSWLAGSERTERLIFVALIALGIGTVFAMCMALVARTTVIELSQFRSPRLREVGRGSFRAMFHLLVCWLVVGGCLGGALVGARELPDWLLSLQLDASINDGVVGAGVVVSLLLQAILVLLLPTALLLCPIVVVEECSAARALAQWLGLVREHLSRILLYEGLAVVIGIVVMLPFLVPVWLATAFVRVDMSWMAVVGDTATLLTGFAVTPMIAYVFVANVMIYLNLRYEYSLSAR